jgi:adenine-specific DNA-methyltransferase
MELNAADGLARKFIMVQYPEVCDEKSEAFRSGYKNICDIAIERIRRAGDKILAEQQAKERESKTDLFNSASDKSATAKPLDIGFRVLKIDDSNMKDVYYSAGEISQQDLIEQISNVKDGRTDLDLLFGCLVDWGVPLSLPIKTETIENLQVYNVNDGDLVACFADDIPEAAIRQIAATKPLRAVFRDSSFKNDSAKINVTEIFKTISPNTTVKVV